MEYESRLLAVEFRRYKDGKHRGSNGQHGKYKVGISLTVSYGDMRVRTELSPDNHRNGSHCKLGEKGRFRHMSRIDKNIRINTGSCANCVFTPPNMLSPWLA